MSGELPGLAPARIWAASRFPYLASAIFGSQVSAVPGIKTVAVDARWRFRADPELVAGWSPAQLGSVLIHLVSHVLRHHGERADGCLVSPGTAGDWIRAADAEINDDLIQASLELPGRPVLPADFGAPDGRLAEEYFALIRKAPPPQPSQVAVAGPASSPGQAGDWLDCGSGADGQGRPWDAGDGGLDPWQAELLERQVARDIIRHAKEAGTVPAGLLRWATELLSPKVDWRRLLAAELRRAVADVAGAADYSYRRPSRRAAATPGVVLPALRRPVPEVAVVCDTSGSMTDDLLAAALREVEGLLSALGLARQLRVLACDTAVAPVQRVSSARQVQLTGGGGTDMGAGIAAAYALRPRPAVAVVLTDGYTPWPGRPPKGMRVIAGLLGDNARDAPGWVRTIRVSDL
ncbi:MAG TPA: VWA-like domain-containing protein [Trebonia sp.]|nr:VWA-like domain-containing protein [Trebonia sp.]